MEHMAEEFRQELLEKGFQEATEVPWNFYRADTELTAFFVNLKILDDHICAFYGFGSTAFTRMAGCENSLIERGIWEMDSCLRFYGEIHSEADARQLREAVCARFRQYRGMDKEALMKRIKALRKEFIDYIGAVMKPLGFRKKSNQWRKPLGENIVLQFRVDKSSFADVYRFEVDIFSLVSRRGLWCWTDRLRKISVEKFLVKGKILDSAECDWQIHSREALDAVLDRVVNGYLLPIQSMPLSQLGAQPQMWKHCICPRDCCESCWIQKNLWEARESE